MPQEVLSLLGILLVLILVLAGSYLFTRWAAGTGLAGRFGASGGGERLRILERLPVGRDQALLVVLAAGRYFVIGSSPSGFSLLAELTEEEGALWTSPPASDGPAGDRPADFRDLLRRLREKK